MNYCFCLFLLLWTLVTMTRPPPALVILVIFGVYKNWLCDTQNVWLSPWFMVHWKACVKYICTFNYWIPILNSRWDIEIIFQFFWYLFSIFCQILVNKVGYLIITLLFIILLSITWQSRFSFKYLQSSWRMFSVIFAF